MYFEPAGTSSLRTISTLSAVQLPNDSISCSLTIDASLLQPCVDPTLAPADASDNELAAERLRVAKAYLDCKARHAALADRVK